MKSTLVQYLWCPKCQSDLHLETTEDTLSDIRQGQLICSAGCSSFPIESGVPRLLPELTGQDAPSQEEIQQRTGEIFGGEWHMYQYGNTTWGVTAEERFHVALHELGWTESDLQGKVILDAGCGNGTLSEILAKGGATVLAMDLSDSVFRAEANCSSPNLHFIQGNLFFPPFKPKTIDAIYSCGVFHHTPDTRRCFDALVPVLKDTVESRYFVWLYERRSWVFNATIEQLMKLTRRMPSSLLVPMCYVIAPFYELGSRIVTGLGIDDHVPRNLQDRATTLYDTLSPEYVHYQTFEEVKGWATEQGFKQIEQTPYCIEEDEPSEAGAAVYKYSTACQPGFGILCYSRS